jgi:basic amino acid/polyamine antiporter, APA family
MCIVVGSTFGIGIFTGPPAVATLVPTAFVLLLLWIGAGVLSLGGAFADAELGAMMPRAGGDYVFQRAAFGQSVAFASGWMLVTGVYAAGLAFMTVALSEIHLENLLMWFDGGDTHILKRTLLEGAQFTIAGRVVVLPSITLAQVAAAAFMLMFTLLNVWGTKQSARVQTVLTLLPFGAVALFALVTLALTPDPQIVQAVAGVPQSPAPELSLRHLVLAYMPIFFAYSGWNVVIYVGGEVENPGRAIPRALIAGLCAITALYALLCVAFVHALGMDGLRAVGEAGGEAGARTAAVFIGDRGKLAMTLLMTVALLTATNGNVLTGGRVAFAMGRDGAFWSGAGKVSRRGTPAVALWVQALLTIVLIFTGTFNQLLQICSIAMIMSGCLNVLALFTLRWRQPQAPRPYRATLYPWFPALYLLANLLAIVVIAHGAMLPGEGRKPDWMPLLGVALFAVVWLGHAIWRRMMAHATAPLR